MMAINIQSKLSWLFEEIRKFLRLYIVTWPGRIALMLAIAGIPSAFGSSLFSLVEFFLCYFFEVPAQGVTQYKTCEHTLTPTKLEIAVGLFCIVLSFLIIVLEYWKKPSPSPVPSPKVGASWGNNTAAIGPVNRLFEQSEYRLELSDDAKIILEQHLLKGPDSCYDQNEVESLSKLIRKINASGHANLKVKSQGYTVKVEL